MIFALIIFCLAHDCRTSPQASRRAASVEAQLWGGDVMAPGSARHHFDGDHQGILGALGAFAPPRRS